MCNCWTTIRSLGLETRVGIGRGTEAGWDQRNIPPYPKLCVGPEGPTWSLSIMSWQNSQGRLDQSYCRAWVISEIKEISGCFPAPAEYSSSHFGGPALWALENSGLGCSMGNSRKREKKASLRNFNWKKYLNAN